ncbi:MAG TPA: hypothetical protein VEK76_10525 [Candidatus Binatia bacterium]|nr:hypothetical protein [Candidatus Binatia bacterium]
MPERPAVRLTPRLAPVAAEPRPVPDPSRPPGNRGPWEEAALTNVDVTEMVKRNLGTVTRPWNK